MAFISGINEITNPLLILVPLIMTVLAGYTVGKVTSKVLREEQIGFLKELIYGNVMLSFVFLSGFIVFGFVISAANGYFVVFTYLLVILFIVSIYLIINRIIRLRSKMRLFLLYKNNKFILFGISLFSSILVYQGIVIYSHPIFSEYDSIYTFLLISKSILLGDGLNQDFYLGSDTAIKLPPFTQAINSWLIHSFGYSSLRLFPIYYVFLSSMFIYALARNVTRDSFLGIIASSAFLITPALLMVSSRFSLQQELPFILLISVSCYFISEIVSHEKPRRIHLIMLLVSLSIMSLTREVGIVLAVAFFFLVPAIKFTQGSIKLRAALTVLSLSPLYLITFSDILTNGFTNSMTVRLASLVIANTALFYILYSIKNQNKFHILLQSNLKYLVVFLVPLIFFVSNIMTIGGPVATYIFSGHSTEYLALYREVFNISNYPDLFEALQLYLPRADIFLASIAMGSIFVFFRLRGFVRLVDEFNKNPNYALLIILIIVLLVAWSYLLASGFEYADVRHIAYFLPITSVLLVLGMRRISSFYKIFYYGVIIFSTYYFLNYDLELAEYNDHFAGFWLEPFKSPIITLSVLVVAGLVILVLLLYEAREEKIHQLFKNYNLARYSSSLLVGMLAVQVYALYSSGISFSPVAEMDRVPPPGWEQDVIKPIEYLSTAEKGNVLSLRAPAISFFTNRTNFDIYNGHVFSSIFPSLLAEKNYTLFKQRLSDMNIKYIVVPNEKNLLYNLTQSLEKSGILLQAIQTSEDFERLNLGRYDLYVFQPAKSTKISLIDQDNIWKPYNDAKVSQNEDQLAILVTTNNEGEIYNRAYLQTQLNSTKTPVVLSLEYASESIAGNATFYAEIRDGAQVKRWGSNLENTNRKSINESFVLPENIVNTPIEFRFYVISDGPGVHTLTVNRALVSYG